MLNIDQFESQFRAAAKSRYYHKPLKVSSVLVVTDLDPDGARRYAERAAPFLTFGPHTPELTALSSADTADLGALLNRVQTEQPDLVITYRCLHSSAWKWPYTVGDHIEVLTQVSEAPVLLLPRIDTGDAADVPLQPPNIVLALSDHIVGENHLVRWAASMCPPHEWLVLTHVEDEHTFERYMALISKVPDVDTEIARREILERMQREAHDWVDSCRDSLEEILGKRAPRVEAIFTLGKRMQTYKQLVARREARLLVLNTKDDDQLAIHGMAYPLMIELRQIPLLLL